MQQRFTVSPQKKRAIERRYVLSKPSVKVAYAFEYLMPVALAASFLYTAFILSPSLAGKDRAPMLRWFFVIAACAVGWRIAYLVVHQRLGDELFYENGHNAAISGEWVTFGIRHEVVGAETRPFFFGTRWWVHLPSCAVEYDEASSLLRFSGEIRAHREEDADVPEDFPYGLTQSVAQCAVIDCFEPSLAASRWRHIRLVRDLTGVCLRRLLLGDLPSEIQHPYAEIILYAGGMER